jgi:hypothetical protein
VRTSALPPEATYCPSGLQAAVQMMVSKVYSCKGVLHAKRPVRRNAMTREFFISGDFGIKIDYCHPSG